MASLLGSVFATITQFTTSSTANPNPLTVSSVTNPNPFKGQDLADIIAKNPATVLTGSLEGCYLSKLTDFSQVTVRNADFKDAV